MEAEALWRSLRLLGPAVFSQSRKSRFFTQFTHVDHRLELMPDPSLKEPQGQRCTKTTNLCSAAGGRTLSESPHRNRGLAPQKLHLPGGGKGGGRKPSGFGALHWLHSVLQAKFWFPHPLDKVVAQQKSPTEFKLTSTGDTKHTAPGATHTGPRSDAISGTCPQNTA